jgi:hypothetical protein
VSAGPRRGWDILTDELRRRWEITYKELKRRLRVLEQARNTELRIADQAFRRWETAYNRSGGTDGLANRYEAIIDHMTQTNEKLLPAIEAAQKRLVEHERALPMLRDADAMKLLLAPEPFEHHRLKANARQQRCLARQRSKNTASELSAAAD